MPGHPLLLLGTAHPPLTPPRSAPPPGCAPGRFFNSSSSACVDCPLGSYCPGGIQNSKTSTATAVATACGTGLTTTTRRARAATSCTNLPGYRFVSGTTPSAVLCTGNTYSVGLRKQPSCTPCSSGFVIATSGGSGADARDSPSDCGERAAQQCACAPAPLLCSGQLALSF